MITEDGVEQGVVTTLFWFVVRETGANAEEAGVEQGMVMVVVLVVASFLTHLFMLQTVS
jgi:hypothetical protein